jgi:superoxide dismutase
MYKLDALQYPYDALEPVIDQKTVEVHHGKHHQTYVNNLNKAIEGLDLKEQTIEELLKDLGQSPGGKAASRHQPRRRALQPLGLLGNNDTGRRKRTAGRTRENH